MNKIRRRELMKEINESKNNSEKIAALTEAVKTLMNEVTVMKAELERERRRKHAQ